MHIGNSTMAYERTFRFFVMRFFNFIPYYMRKQKLSFAARMWAAADKEKERSLWQRQKSSR